jgi:ribosomal protein L11 methyltransferase
MMNYYAFSFTVTPETQEMLLAFLAEWPFESFEEREETLVAFLPAAQWKATFPDELADWIKELPLATQFSWEEIQATNWNAEWESKFDPIRVDDFCGLRADFHPPFQPPVKYDLRIQPKMAFGTGHHATTFMMLSHMQQLEGAIPPSALDFGCGTGVLAILAAQMGVEQVYAVDIEEASYENTLENAEVNDTPQIQVFQGSLEDVPDRAFSLILANINRNVILHYLPALYDRLEAGGRLWVSGILDIDKTVVTDAASTAGFLLGDQDQRNQWLFLEFLKESRL